MSSEAEAFVAYWLRVVRIGLVTTGLALGVLVFLPLISKSPDIQTGPYFAILGVGAGVGLVVMLLPWRRLFESELGMLILYAWSCVDIALISLAIAVTGGGRSELFLLYGLTTVFFAFYPRRAQPPLLSLTFASYLSALALTGWEVATAGVFLRLALLTLLALMASFLSLELARRTKAAEEARTRLERWASLMSTAAAAGRSMTLEPNGVADVAVESAIRMGFDEASLCALDDEARTYHVVQARGLPEEHAAGVYRASEGLTGLVLQKGETVVVEDYSALPEDIPSVRHAGLRAAIGSPIWVGGWLAAVLEAGNRREGPLTPQEVEAFEMLAAQAGLALENARRYEEERRTVERLEEMDRLKTDFLNTASHELRTPLTVIQGAGITLEQTWEAVDANTRRRLLSGLNANARSLETLITSLLDFSRLEAGKREATLRPMDVSELLEAAAERLNGLFEHRRLVVRIARGLVAGGDASMIERAVENLLSNAAKHTPEGTVVTLSAQRQEEGILVAVSDDGPGIAEEDLPYLGERFFRGGDVNVRPKGLGLGLALVREILALHERSGDREPAGEWIAVLLPARLATIPRATHEREGGPDPMTPTLSGTSAPGVGDPAPDATVLDLHGDGVTLSSFWKDRPAVLVFLRYFGCPFCQAQVVSLRDNRERFREAGANVVLIGQGDIEDGLAFTGSREVPFPVLLDPDRVAYRAYGLVRGTIMQVLGPQAVLPFVRENLRAETRQRGLKGGDLMQMPGTFVVDTGGIVRATDGVVRFAHRNKHVADTPRNQVILDVLAELGVGPTAE